VGRLRLRWGDGFSALKLPTNKAGMRPITAAHKTKLAKGEVGITEHRKVPTLREFALRFQAEIKVHCAGKPRTIAFWDQKLTRLLEFSRLASSPLDKINTALIAS